MRAQYLLRFDDICPSMNWSVWTEVEAVLREYCLRPVLAVVPDNRDQQLVTAPAVPDFWDRVRAWQAQGWTIAMHGYQHRYTSQDPGLMGLNHYSEFAGHSEAEQYARLLAGRSIFESNGIRPDVFIAPAHSFDWTTIKALSQLGFRFISDGFSPWPSTDRFGIVWIPQQLWSFRYRPFGVWTICLHMNGWAASDLQSFSEGIRKYASAITDVQSVINSSRPAHVNAFKRFSGVVYGAAIHLKKRLRAFRSKSHAGANSYHPSEVSVTGVSTHHGHQPQS